MDKWADYFISEVSYDSDHLISVAIRHQDTGKGITAGEPVDRLTIHSDIINGLSYITIYSGIESWKKGHKIQTFSIEGKPFIRIDENKVKLDNLGDLLEGPVVKSESVKELEFQPEPEPEPKPEPKPESKPESKPEPPSSPRGSLPKGFTKELHQEPKPEAEEATPQQITQLDKLQKQISELEKEIKKSKSTHTKRKITKPLRKRTKSSTKKTTAKPKKQTKSSTKKITSKSTHIKRKITKPLRKRTKSSTKK